MRTAARTAWALPCVLASALVVLLPVEVRPPAVAWVLGALACAILPVLAVRRRAWMVGLAALATALGMLVQLRLGVPAGRLGLVGAASAGLTTAGAVLGRSPAVTRRLEDVGQLRLLALLLLGAAVLLRGATVLGPAPAAGTLPLVGVQVGELTRHLLVGGLALALADPLRRGPWCPADRRYATAATALGAVGIGLLVALHDLGPALLVTLGVVVAAVHVGALRTRGVVVGGLVALLAAPAAWTLPVLHQRVNDVVSPGPQVTAALAAIWSGGLLGPGPGRSPLVAGVPAISSDYAVAALAADLGTLVVVPVVLALLAGLLRLVADAATRRGPANTLAVALAAMLAVQGCWTALGTVAVVPLTGLNAPFLGVSGAATTTSALVLGLVLGVLDRPATATPAPGGRALSAAARATLPVVSVLLAAASLLLVVSPRAVGDAEQLRMPRGTIWTADGQVVATDGDGGRRYPAGGRYADLGFARWNDTHRGVEAVEADVLTCGGRLGTLDLVASLVHPVCRPADVVTTVDARAQAALAGVLGTGVAGEGTLIDARDGSVLALESSSSVAPEVPSSARTATGPPGSTMKLVTASAALLDDVDFAAAPRTEVVGDDGARLGNDGGATCPAADPVTALADSCNSVYGWAADRVGAPELARVARTWFGADQTFRLDGLTVAGLSTGLDPSSTGGRTARAGIGQESVRSSVLGVALATEVVANGGSTTRWPHVVAATCTGAGPGPRPPAPVVGPPLPREVADVVRSGMRAAVGTGTARHLDRHGRDVVAKTGTAQLPRGGDDSWITAIVDGRWVLTLVLHDADREGAAVEAASRVLAALPVGFASPTCPPGPTTEAS